MIHIANGDIVGSKLGNLPDEVLVWREMYDMGPLAQVSSKEEWIERRALFFENKLAIPRSLFIKNCEEQDRYLDGLNRDREIVLWFEHDRFDQTMFMYLLNELTKKEFTNISMVTIDRYPGIEHFHGLGQLTSQQLEELFYKMKQPISADQFDEAITGWKAYTSPNPIDIEKWLTTSKGKLPFLKQVLKSNLSYFPSCQTGLNDVEVLVLNFLYENPSSFWELFQYISEKRPEDGLSDFHLASIINELVVEKKPLIDSDKPLPNYLNSKTNPKLQLTNYGLNEKRNFERNWWVGGVNLKDNQWFLDENGHLFLHLNFS